MEPDSIALAGALASAVGIIARLALSGRSIPVFLHTDGQPVDAFLLFEDGLMLHPSPNGVIYVPSGRAGARVSVRSSSNRREVGGLRIPRWSRRQIRFEVPRS